MILTIISPLAHHRCFPPGTGEIRVVRDQFCNMADNSAGVTIQEQIAGHASATEISVYPSSSRIVRTWSGPMQMRRFANAMPMQL